MMAPEEYTELKMMVLKRLSALSQQVIIMNPQSNERSVKNIERDMKNLRIEIEVLTSEKTRGLTSEKT